MKNATNTVVKADVENVAKGIGQKLTPAEVETVIERYPSAQDQDPTATWNLVVEEVVYQVIDERK